MRQYETNKNKKFRILFRHRDKCVLLKGNESIRKWKKLGGVTKTRKTRSPYIRYENVTFCFRCDDKTR